MQTFLTALLNTLMGMGTVFLVLIFISLIISLFKYVPQLEKRLKGGKEEQKETEDEIPQIIREMEEEDFLGDEELVAVITAAIMAYQGGTSTSTDRLVVRSIRRARHTGRR